MQRRSDDTINPKLATGEVEVLAREIRILNEAKTPPFQIAEDAPVSEDVRLRYRYLDLRRPRLQHNIGLRHRVTMAIRNDTSTRNGFWEIETPILTKSTPEGARDFLVPSRVHPGEFYALPQSPQIFKQILMIAGMDRYFQIVALLPRRGSARRPAARVHAGRRRDVVRAAGDDLRPHRAADAADLQGDRPRDVALPIRRMPYAEAIARYGSDKPDLRFGLEIHDLSDVFRDSEFRVFKQIVADGGVVRGFAVPGRQQVLAQPARRARRSGEADGVHRPDLGPSRRAAAQLGEGARAKATLRPALDRVRAGSDDLLLMAAGPADATSKLLGQLRLAIAKKENLLNPEAFEFLWVTDFPLLEYHEEDERWYSMHHPFTSPLDEDIDEARDRSGRACAPRRTTSS